MKHAVINKKINEIFKDTYSTGDVKYDSQDASVFPGPYIALKYSPMRSDRVFIGIGDAGVKNRGTLRVYVYDKNAQKCLEKLDELDLMFKDRDLNGLHFTELYNFQSCQRQVNGDLYVTFIEFEACIF